MCAGRAKLIENPVQHVELPDRAQFLGNLTQAAAELPEHVCIQLQHGKHFPQAARRYPGLVESPDVAFLQIV
jgi:hypothetical protein